MHVNRMTARLTAGNQEYVTNTPTTRHAMCNTPSRLGQCCKHGPLLTLGLHGSALQAAFSMVSYLCCIQAAHCTGGHLRGSALHVGRHSTCRHRRQLAQAVNGGLLSI